MREPNSALLTDQYQLTMLQAYFLEGMEAEATFELFVRRFPPTRNFLVAAGLQQLIEFLERFHVSSRECQWLAGTGLFRSDFLDYLGDLRFTGEVWAMPEGTVFFPNEPIVRISAPMPQAQIVETRLINLIQLQTLIASKAVRSVLAAPDKLLVEFGLRRAHGFEAGLLAARAAYLAGFSGSSNVLASKVFGMPAYGTMAHSYIMAHDDEADAFERFAESLPHNVVLLIDTYDTLAGARKIVGLAPRLTEKGIAIHSVRLDSGDLVELSKATRKILNEGGLTGCRIFASGDLDEHEVGRMLSEGAPIDGFGIGTRLVTSADAPYLNCAYKLQEYAGRPRRKRSKGKETWPGRKQVFRFYDSAGLMSHDVLTLAADDLPGEPMLRPVMRDGRRLDELESLTDARDRVLRQLRQLPARLKSLNKPESYSVKIGGPLRQLVGEMERRGE